ncbi:MAG: VanW family protein [Anaerolineales bacterium]|jgi:vancomycin resistance protein YoaR
MSSIGVSQSKRPPLLLQFLAAIIGGLVLFVVGAGAISSGYQLLFSDRIFPGIVMAGVDLSSLTPAQASEALSQHLPYPKSGKIVFTYGDRVWVATPADLGMVFDAGTSVQRAYGLGRQSGLLVNMTTQLNAWQGGLYLGPVIIFDARVAQDYLDNIAAQIDQPVVEADLHLDGTEVVYTPGQIGRLVNVDQSIANLLAQLKTFRDGEIPLVIEEHAPLIMDASAQAESLRQALNGPLVLNINNAQNGDPGPWTINQSDLAGMMTIARVKTDSGWQYQVSIDTHSIQLFLEQIAPLVNRSSANARFYFDDGSRQLVLTQHAVIGRTLDVSATRDAIMQKIFQGDHTFPVTMSVDQPAVGDNATAASLGITGLVSDYTSYFRGSPAVRLQNIQAASSRFYGLLIPPNMTFSMGDAIGDISLNNGYAEALIIYNGKTITGVGGGVCQVSTTLFRTAFFGGYPIVERNAHAYRVYYYEQTDTGTDPLMAGLDATVYFPLVDLKFTNDRPYWLLMETYFSAQDDSLKWKFYSGDDGRTVSWKNQGLRNVVPAPAPLIVENPDLPPGTCTQTDYAGDGADITVVRTVTRNGQQLTLDGNTINTHYQPWQAVYQYGPGVDNPQALVAQGLCH